MTDPNRPQMDARQAAGALEAADHTMSVMTFALEQHARMYDDLPVPLATRAMLRDLMGDDDNDRSNLAAAAAMLAVQCARGLIGQPYGMLAVPARVVVYSLMALDDAGCQFAMCTGPTLEPVDMRTCRRCEALAMLREWTGLGEDAGDDVEALTVQLADRGEAARAAGDQGEQAGR